MEYHNNLRRLRDQKALTQAEVAARVGLNQAEYSRIEKGKRRVGTHLKKLTAFFKCSDDDILADNQPTIISDDLPVYALPEGDGVRFDLAMSSRTGRPFADCESPDAFALFAQGSSMEPRLNHGDLVYCNPDLELQMHDLCAVVVKQGNRTVALLREYIGDNTFLRSKDDAEEVYDKELVQCAPAVIIRLAR